MNKPLKTIPKFSSEPEERVFWEQQDSTDYLDWTKAQQVVLPNLKPSTKTISLRLPQHLLDSIKAAANSRDVPYQSLIKVWLQEKLHSQ
ncbi:MAG: BrnA antitoxin family protein [Methylococcaceae bacterium]